MKHPGTGTHTTLSASVGILALAGAALALTATAGSAQAHSTTAVTKKPKVGHVWTIILENKSYESIFTGLNQSPD